MTKQFLLLAVFISFAAVVPATAQAGQPWPAGDPQEARYRMLAERWNKKASPEVPVVCASKHAEMKAKWQAMTPEQKRALQASVDARQKEQQAMTPEQRKAAAIRLAAARDTWESLTPAEREAAKKRMLDRIDAARKSVKKQQKQ